ncbi:RagB/SusD family nutrient uptake outer membrane protein [Pontixanthobacter gangjinensis]|uniref:RagB/SusD family nutrient uptake outer membrane protein n=1 Tax=Christiangramia aestuarii TaxID=1028746 RepID=A0A7K1LPI9_9FLAO|nr:RagB/SusD family nutrient uptake outer membrane protein [Christiangramia aestuarii]MUP42551.1 RagB/SusD family nutrient uptake outer membrane protein [Christiangramia aestuarii]
MKKILLILLVSILAFGCTTLDEELNDTVDSDVAATTTSTESLLESAYQAMRMFDTQDNIFALQEHTSDELAGPTRGPDWDDGGVWRNLHTHSWASSNNFINSAYTGLLSGIFRSTQVLEFDPSPEQAAQARFLRAFFAFHLVDNFGLVLGREPGEDLTTPPSITLNRPEGINFVISELEEIIDDLPDNGDPTVANQNAAHFLLAKAYLNKAVYMDTNENNGANPGPFSFDAADMNTVIEHVDAIISSGDYDLETMYFDNFSPTNTDDSSENIFVSENVRGNNPANTQSRWHMTLHYNNQPDGWNGFVTLAEIYDLYEDGDMRRNFTPDYFEGNTGMNAGFLLGQQFAADGSPLEDRNGDPLAFTKDFSLTASSEVAGIRVIKYPVDFQSIGSPGNDYVHFRYADALLMKAEAILRGGSATMGDTPESLVNSIRELRQTSNLASVSLDDILDERARELYWEGWRRNDQIRFSTYLDAHFEKPETTTTYLLFPIPPDALATNPNLTQNPGY